MPLADPRRPVSPSLGPRLLLRRFRFLERPDPAASVLAEMFESPVPARDRREGEACKDDKPLTGRFPCPPAPKNDPPPPDYPSKGAAGSALKPGTCTARTGCLEWDPRPLASA